MKKRKSYKKNGRISLERITDHHRIRDLGTHSDVTEERDEIKAPKLISENQETLTFLTDAKLNEQPKMDMKNESLLENGPSVPAYRSADKFPVPFSSVGLFRLPTDYEYGEKTTKTTTRANSLSYGSRLSLTNYPTDSSPYRESLSRSLLPWMIGFAWFPPFLIKNPFLKILNYPHLPLIRYWVCRSAFDPRFDMPVCSWPKIGCRHGVVCPWSTTGCRPVCH